MMRRTRSKSAEDLFVEANEYWDRGHLKSAFRFFLRAAQRGDVGAQVNLGFFYDTGCGVARNRNAAMQWYKKAYRRGSAEAAANIATIFAEEGLTKRALSWFDRAVKLGNGDANLEIAKIHLKELEVRSAMRYLAKIVKADKESVTQQSREDAERLLTGC
jgi:TPR repeat protein